MCEQPSIKRYSFKVFWRSYFQCTIVTFNEGETFFFDPLVLEKFFDGKLRFDEDFQNVEVEVKKNSQKISGPFSPVELAHWEKSCET